MQKFLPVVVCWDLSVTFMLLLSLAGTQLLSTTVGVKEYVQSEFDSVQAEIISTNKDLFPGSITFDDFLWAFRMLRSRVFPELRGDKLALIPFADLVICNTYWRFPDSNPTCYDSSYCC